MCVVVSLMYGIMYLGYNGDGLFVWVSVYSKILGCVRVWVSCACVCILCQSAVRVCVCLVCMYCVCVCLFDSCMYGIMYLGIRIMAAVCLCVCVCVSLCTVLHLRAASADTSFFGTDGYTHTHTG